MRRKAMFSAALAVCAAMFGSAALCATGPVKISTMTRVESHSKMDDGSGNYGSEVLGYQMVSLFRELDKGTIGGAFYMNRFSIDEGETMSHIMGVNLTQVFCPKLIGTVGYTHTINEERGPLAPKNKKDRFSGTAVVNFNPKSQKGPLYSLTSSYSTMASWSEQQSLNEQFEVKFPKLSARLDGALSYTYSYSVADSDQITNQFAGRLGYKLGETTKLTLGALLIDNVYDGNPGDDVVGRLTLTKSFR
jgi:hypothetical protein